MMKA
jgi:hypothetical protein